MGFMCPEIGIYPMELFECRLPHDISILVISAELVFEMKSFVVPH